MSIAGARARQATTTKREQALAHAECGRAVFPVYWVLPDGRCSCGDSDCKSPGKHPLTPTGFRAATTDPGRIRRWWGKLPEANIGFPTGMGSGVVVLDVDPRHHGNESLAALEREHGPLPTTVEAITGGGGRHLYFLSPGHPIRNSAGSLGSGLDIRGDGGYVLLPGSVTAHAYIWEVRSHPDDIAMAAMPGWLLALCSEAGRRHAEPLPEVIREGERNDRLFSLAGSMRRRGASKAAIEAALREENLARCAPPLPEDELRRIAASVGRYAESDPEPNGLATARLDSGASLQSTSSAPDPWPSPLAPEALYGFAGEFVHAITPFTEADPVASLGHLLAGVGVLVGGAVHAIAGDAVHPAKLNAVIVGETAKSRKGSAQRPIERLLRDADPSFGPRIMEGLSSGEGLIWHVRDPIMRAEREGRGSERTTSVVEVDSGVPDKRLLVIESEFASVLRAVERDGNTLSAVVRRAWDRADLRTLTKNTPAVATGSHIAVVGHVTRDELLRYLDRTEVASGFANRFMWLAARRGQLLPDGEMVPAEIIADFGKRLAGVVEWAREPRRLSRDAEAASIWRNVYRALAEGQPGMFGAATSRAEAQALRLSVTYAILDRSPVIRAEHLLAALAVWRYAEDTARWLFGDALGDPTADTILGALRSGGPLTRNQIVDLFGRNVNRGRLDRALGLLLKTGRAVSANRNDTGGRPAEVWFAV